MNQFSWSILFLLITSVTSNTANSFKNCGPGQKHALSVACVPQNGLERSVQVINEAVAGKNLRIQPLGDSITYGYQSTDGNGYRNDLVQLLSGNTINMIGSSKSGNMSDNDNEGHSGAIISEIAKNAKKSLPERPNIVLLHAGTNDVDRQIDLPNAPARLGRLIDEIIAACPDASVLVALIIGSRDVALQNRINSYNAAIQTVIEQKAQGPKHINVVDMAHLLQTDDMADNLHPNDAGYKKMAVAWLEGIKRANEAGWIKDPVNFK